MYEARSSSMFSAHLDVLPIARNARGGNIFRVRI